MRFNDNTSLQIGGGADFSVHHDGGNTLVQNITGHLYFYQKEFPDFHRCDYS